MSPGNAYELSPSSGGWSYTSLYQFNGGEDYGGVSGNLLRDASGNLYGPVMTGGTSAKGSIFELSPGSGGWTYENLHNFVQRRDGTGPQGSIVLDVNGNLYGAASYGGQHGDGTIYEISLSGTQVK